jgi:hypothetical protein
VKFQFLETERFEWRFTLRMPFRFGAITVRDGIQAVVRVRIGDATGKEGFGMAAETLAAKWFDKDAALTDADNQHQLRRALEIAEAQSRAAGFNTAFGHYADGYHEYVAACAAEGLNPLVASFGRALWDRAAFDALLRLAGLSFDAGLRANLGGMAPHPVIADLAGFDFAVMLAHVPRPSRLHARHTVGLVDPITSADQTDAVNDGLPETLEQVLTTYRPLYWKLKVSGEIRNDVARLCRIASVLDRLHGYFATLDGNEQYEDTGGVLELWRAMEAEPRLTRLRASILFIEQPIKRSQALRESIAHLAAARPVIIDESDDALDAFLIAKSLGYTGVSSKACKGIWRSLINLARCRQWGRGYFMSAEDLTTLAGLCVQQDLALVSALGLVHVERNGHHFIDGFAGRPITEARAYRAAHPDLYEDTPKGPRLRMREGLLEIGSLATPGMGSMIWPDIAAMQPMAKAAWPI